MEDKKKESVEQTKENPLDKLKGFVCRHGKEIAIGAGVTAIGVGAVIFLRKNPERFILSFTGLLDSDEKPEIFEITDAVGVEEDPFGESQEIDFGEAYSARRLGDMIGLSAQQVNKKLAELGYLEGEPGNWTATERGKEVSVQNAYDNGVGGYYRIYNPYYEWKKEIVYELGDPDAYRERINNIRTKLDIEPTREVA